MKYSGERQLLGIATMHKSNMVPVFADQKEQAKEIASMRR
jgi:phage terminase large subunit-like protein